ncbi:terminase large subunit [Clostridium cochlearium]|uniref:terminase large subunit n=1 Tax=Clostridium cochlearium TaxID=1494 RepID=UPI000BBC461D|nr:terminase TerL endonuclease subunit [Clostridium cochlearium]
MILLDKALKYAIDVVTGKEITTKEVKKQCKKFKNDYENRQYKNEFEYYFDEDKLKIINDLLKLMNFATGFVAGKQVLEGLEGFQAFFICNIFGWRYKSNKNKFRYRDVVLYIPRKNAKTFIISVVLLILMLTEQNFSEFYSICIDRDLAKEVRKAMAQLISASPALQKHFFVSDSEIGIIKCKITNSFYYPRTSKADKNNSIRPATFIADEMGAFNTSNNIQAMRKGQLSVLNPLQIITTTAYANSDSIMLEELTYAKAVLNGTFENENYFALLYYATEEEVRNNTDVAIERANPLRVEQNYIEIKKDWETSLIKINEQKEILTKNFNIFLETDELNGYLNMESWKKCRITKEKFEEVIKGKDVYLGVDFSKTTDLTSVSIMFTHGGKIYCKSHGFLPKGSLDKRREKIDYRKNAKLGNCTICDGDVVNLQDVEDYINSIEEKYNCKILKIYCDPAYKGNFGLDMNKYNLVMLKQTYTILSLPTKNFRDEVYKSNVYYEENELLDWNMQCATTSVGKSDDEMLNKQDKNKQRIDMVATLIFAYVGINNNDKVSKITEIMDDGFNW